MLKLVAAGIWIILVTAGATFASVYLSAERVDASDPTEDAGVEELSSDMTSIPVMKDGDVTGYLILQLSFAADKNLLDQRKVDPMPFMRDAAFRVVFANADLDFRRLKKVDLDRLTDEVAKEANARLGFNLVRGVLLQQFNFVRKEDIRTNWIGDGGATEH